jgi:hypothetical protein
MSTPVTQLNNDGTAEVVEPQEFPGYYIVNGQKVDPNGNPWKAPRKAKDEDVAAEETAAKTPAEPDPVTGRRAR